MGKLRTFSPAPEGDLVVGGRTFRRAHDPSADAVRNSFRQVVDKRTGQPEVKTLLEGGLYGSDQGNLRNAAYKGNVKGVADPTGTTEMVKHGRTRSAPVQTLSHSEADCDVRRMRDPRFHAINNEFRQGMDQETGRTNVAEALAGKGYHELTNPDVGDETFRRTARKGKHSTRQSHEISAEASAAARWSGKLHTKDFVRANKLAAKKGEFVRGAGAAKGSSRLRSASASAAASMAVGTDGRVYGHMNTATTTATATRAVMTSRTTGGGRGAKSKTTAAAFASSRPQSARVATRKASASASARARPQSARTTGSERWSEWDTYGSVVGGPTSGARVATRAAASAGEDPFAGFSPGGGGGGGDGRGGAGGGYAPTIGAPRSSEHWSEWDAYSERGAHIVKGAATGRKQQRPQSAGAKLVSSGSGAYEYQQHQQEQQQAQQAQQQQSYHTVVGGANDLVESYLSTLDTGGEPINFGNERPPNDDRKGAGGGYAPTIGAPRSSEHWSEWDEYSERGGHIVKAKKQSGFGNQDQGGSSSSRMGANGRRNSTGGGGGAFHGTRAGAYDSRVESPTRNGAGGGYAPTIGAPRSSEHWSEWDEYSERGGHIVNAKKQGGKKVRPQSARPYVPPAPAVNAAIPVRMDPLDEFKVQKRGLMIQGGAGVGALTGGQKVKSVVATREINAAVRSVQQAGGVRRPIALAKTRANDVATVKVTGPSAHNPTGSHRQFVRNLERMMRQANARR